MIRVIAEFTCKENISFAIDRRYGDFTEQWKFLGRKY